MTNTYEAVKKRKALNVLNTIVIFCACVLAVSGLYAFLPVNGEHKIYSDLIRLHIIANSDSDGDQKLKFELRDYMLDDISKLTEDCINIDEAVRKINRELVNIEAKALEFISKNGYDYPVAVTLAKELYPTREYTGDDNSEFILPSGKYISLRITIGDAGGQNWWCVLFPPICLSGTKIEDELAIAGYSNEQINILKKDKDKKYVIRFKILEVLSGLIK